MTRRFQVLCISQWYPTKERPTVGLFVRDLVQATTAFDDFVSLHCDPGATARLNTAWALEQETDITITKGIPTYQLKQNERRGSHFLYIWSTIRAFRILRSQGFRPDLIHAHVYKAAVPAVLLGKAYRIPVIITEHSTDFARRRLPALHRWLTRLAFRLADTVLPVSRSLQHSIEQHGIYAKFQVVPNVVDTKLFYLESDVQRTNCTKRLLTIGTMNRTHKKGLPFLLQALAQERRTDWHLDIVGDGISRSQYEQMATELGLAEQVTFLGVRSKPEVAALMRQADLAIVPSLFETFSVVAAEALAAGVPVLATRCGGPEEFITNEVGMLVSPGDVDALKTGLTSMLDNLEMYSYDSIARYARERFAPDIIGAKIHSIYQTALSQR